MMNALKGIEVNHISGEGFIIEDIPEQGLTFIEADYTNDDIGLDYLTNASYITFGVLNCLNQGHPVWECNRVKLYTQKYTLELEYKKGYLIREALYSPSGNIWCEINSSCEYPMLYDEVMFEEWFNFDYMLNYQISKNHFGYQESILLSRGKLDRVPTAFNFGQRSKYDWSRHLEVELESDKNIETLKKVLIHLNLGVDKIDKDFKLFTTGGVEMSYETQGSGFKYVFNLLSKFLTNDRDTFIICNPYCGLLHPLAEKELIRILKDLNKNKQLIIFGDPAIKTDLPGNRILIQPNNLIYDEE